MVCQVLRSCRGFTLMEVLVAMIVISLGLLAAIKVVSEITTSAIQMEEKTIAQWVATNKIREMMLQKGLPPTGKTNGELEMAGRDWYWELNITKTDYSAIRQLEVAVKPVAEKDSEAPTILMYSLMGNI